MQEVSFLSQATRLFAVEDGVGLPVVMLHGGMADHLATLPFVGPLLGRCRVIAPDLRASGRSHDAGPLSFDQLADDVIALLDHLGLTRAVVGGASGGSGVALRCALRHPGRVSGLALLLPVYAGAARGYTPAQAGLFQGIEALTRRVVAEGVQVLRPLYGHLPDGVREQAWAMLDHLDAASVAATGRFLASGEQPFGSDDELRALRVPTLIVPGADPMHPPEVAALYAASIPGCAVASLPPDPAQHPATAAQALAAFCAARAASET